MWHHGVGEKRASAIASQTGLLAPRRRCGQFGGHMRAFIALELPEAFAADVAGISRQLSAVLDGRFVSEKNHHVTLAFLGDICEADVRLCMDAMDAACDGMGPIPISSDGLGKFGRASDATLWLGIRGEGLGELARRVREELRARGVGFDEKGFLAHVTLARRVRIKPERLGDLAFPADDQIVACTLFRSTLSSSGATYKSLYTVTLGEE